MQARTLYEAGQLEEAIAALGADLRGDPTDLRRRTFLFELLCFAGEYDRAEKHWSRWWLPFPGVTPRGRRGWGG